ncbi:hypothetical protein TNIN_48171 [Trichonephila inaurata madagascariensis]|uniref:Uncharacterized protein n=1 Tax=Trichonephila inaurata madagascariensis TaxID=2747483 RepID=A0A8X6YJT5_9ARAC|nr:hypothetical protein TNIN_48171 [Trichonephila inaurata madagascariensis]
MLCSSILLNTKFAKSRSQQVSVLSYVATCREPSCCRDRRKYICSAVQILPCDTPVSLKTSRVRHSPCAAISDTDYTVVATAAAVEERPLL